MWNNPLLLWILPVKVGVLAIIVAIYLHFLSKKKKELGYEIMQNLSLVSVEEDARDRIELYFDKKKVMFP